MLSFSLGLKAKNVGLGLVACGLVNKKAQLSLTNPRDASEKFARFT